MLCSHNNGNKDTGVASTSPFQLKTINKGELKMKKASVMFFLLLLCILFSLPVSASTLCPDGQYHADGSCKLCPDGSYTTAPRCSLAPDGNYTPDYGRGTRLTPNGNYIPETGSMVLCPDGNYYPGRSCRLMPDGRYMGSQ